MAMSCSICESLGHCPRLPQLDALCRAVAQGLQYCVRVFAYHWADTANATRCLGEFNGNASLTDLAIAVILDVYYHLTGDDLWILKCLCDRIDRTDTDVLVLEKCTPLVPRFLAENALDFRLGVLHSTIGQSGKVITTQGQAG